MADSAHPSRAPLSPNNFARLVLILVGVVWLGVGVSGLLSPVGTAALVDYDLESNTALAEFRAMYGGLSLALAFLHIGAAVRGAWLRPALLMSASCTAGLLLGRVSTLAFDGMFGPVALGLAGAEVGLLALSGAALWRLWRAPVAGAAPAPAPALADEDAPTSP